MGGGGDAYAFSLLYIGGKSSKYLTIRENSPAYLNALASLLYRTVFIGENSYPLMSVNTVAVKKCAAQNYFSSSY